MLRHTFTLKYCLKIKKNAFQLMYVFIITNNPIFIFCRMGKVLSLELYLGALLVHDQNYREFTQILQTISIGSIQNCNHITSSQKFQNFWTRFILIVYGNVLYNFHCNKELYSQYYSSEPKYYYL